jgi:hypothetical protein
MLDRINRMNLNQAIWTSYWVGLERYDVKVPRNHTARNAKLIGGDRFLCRALYLDDDSSFACDVIICCFVVYHGDFIHLSTSQQKRHLSQHVDKKLREIIISLTLSHIFIFVTIYTITTKGFIHQSIIISCCSWKMVQVQVWYIFDWLVSPCTPFAHLANLAHLAHLETVYSSVWWLVPSGSARDILPI